MRRSSSPGPSDPLDLHRGNRINREHWRNVCAAILSRMPWDAIHAMAAAGYSEFHRVARAKYHGHGFRDEDFRYMFAVIQQTAKTRRRVDPRLILGTDHNPLAGPVLGPDGRPARPSTH